MEDFFEGKVEFVEIVFVKMVFVLVDYVENKVVGGVDRKFFDCVLFGVESFGD